MTVVYSLVAFMSATQKAQELRELIRMLTEASEVVIKEWEAAEQEPAVEPVASLPSAGLYEARRVMIGACGMCVDLVQEPENRLSDVGFSYFLSRALHIAVQARVADVLDGADPNEGLSSEVIGEKVGINALKLTRVLRSLCTVHIFKEVKNGYFANSRTSQALVGNDYLRCWILVHAGDIHATAHTLLPFLFDPVKTHSTSSHVSAFQDVIGTDLTLWEYIEQGIEQPDGTVIPRPDNELYSLGMIGGGRLFGSGIYYDYPWEALGAATVVDVGGGVGGTSLDLARRFPKLHLIVEDRPSSIEKAEEVWQQEYPEAIKAGRVKLLSHDFFTEQPIKGAEVYFLRHVLHDWPDDECVAILSQLRGAMGPDSIVMIVEKVIHTTVGSPQLKSAPPPLLPNYGSAHQSGNMHDLIMMAVHNGMERTPEMLDALANRAGMKLSKIWECRGIISVIELRSIDV